MVEFALVALAVALGGAVLLAAGGAVHVRDPGGLRTALTVQQLVPARLRPAVATATGPLELLMGAAVIGCWLAAPGAVRWPLVGVAVGYAVLAAYTGVVRVRRPSAPCGCFGAGGPVSWLIVGRAAAFAVASGIAVLVLPAVADLPLADRSWPLAPAVLIAVTAWLGPELATPATFASGRHR